MCKAIFLLLDNLIWPHQQVILLHCGIHEYECHRSGPRSVLNMVQEVHSHTMVNAMWVYSYICFNYYSLICSYWMHINLIILPVTVFCIISFCSPSKGFTLLYAYAKGFWFRLWKAPNSLGVRTCNNHIVYDKYEVLFVFMWPKYGPQRY